jgi:hypothetical protein
MKKLCLVLLVLSMACCVCAQGTKPSAGGFILTDRPSVKPQIPGQIFYAGGPIMSGATNVYVVFYGDWPAASVNIINGYLQNLGGTLYYKVNTNYWDNSGAHVQNIVNYNPATNSINDNYSLGRSLTDADVQTIVSNAIAGALLPNDEANGVYFVLTAADVTESLPGAGSFCAGYCGYHSPSNSIVTGEAIKYSFIGNPMQCPSGCDGNVKVFHDTTTPNGDLGGDGTVNVLFHELSESVSDPLVTLDLGLRAWGAQLTGESGDLCAWVFGKGKTAANGSHYNETINNTHYLIQELFRVPKKVHGSKYYSGNCVLSVK